MAGVYLVDLFFGSRLYFMLLRAGVLIEVPASRQLFILKNSERTISLQDEVDLLAHESPSPNDVDGIRHAVAKRMAATLPNVELLEFEQMGHMGPVTHPDAVNEAISVYLQKIFY